MNGWNPTHTAPTDGTAVEVWAGRLEPGATYSNRYGWVDRDGRRITEPVEAWRPPTLEPSARTDTPNDAQEPEFILKGGDPLASYLVDIWACMRAGETTHALGNFYGMLLNFPDVPTPSPLIETARADAADMREFYTDANPQNGR